MKTPAWWLNILPFAPLAAFLLGLLIEKALKSRQSMSEARREKWKRY
jgi:hypothetical protein